MPSSASLIHRPARGLRVPAILDKTGLSRTALYRLIAEDKFPKLHKLTERVCVGNEAEIDAWLEAKFRGEKA